MYRQRYLFMCVVRSAYSRLHLQGMDAAVGAEPSTAPRQLMNTPQACGSRQPMSRQCQKLQLHTA